MRKLIRYFEPYFDPYTHEYDYDKGQQYDVIANTEEEYVTHMASITNPSRGIPQDSITVEDLPPEFTEQERIRADIDYIAAMTGVDLDV